MRKSFGTVLNCIDGRTQIPVINWIKENFDVEYVDLITEPGMDKIVSEGNPFYSSRLKNKISISVKAHKSKIIGLVGHYDCAGNPVDAEVHYRQIEEATNLIKNWNFSVDTIVGLWVDEFWEVHVVSLYKRI